MNNISASVNGVPSIAILTNVSLFSELVSRVMHRTPHLPGIGVFHGPSGYGKTFAATYAAHKTRAFYLEVGESWTKAKFVRMLLVELGREPRGTVADMVEAAIAALAMTPGRPLIVDEADWIVKRGYIETVRELHDKSGTPIILIGEELLPAKIAAVSERTHNRVLAWEPAQPADADDAAAVARLYVPGVEVRRDLLDFFVAKTGGRIRRVCVNLDRAREQAETEGLKSIGRPEWGDKTVYTGQAPARRAA
jgi:DNA transposition AAA+ family ATPase